MVVVSNLDFFSFFRLMWEFLGLESERGGSVCWSNNKIIEDVVRYNFIPIILKLFLNNLSRSSIHRFENFCDCAGRRRGWSETPVTSGESRYSLSTACRPCRARPHRRLARWRRAEERADSRGRHAGLVLCNEVCRAPCRRVALQPSWLCGFAKKRKKKSAKIAMSSNGVW